LELREQIAFGCRVLHRLGVQPSHISARLPGTPYFVVKTRGGGGAGVTRDQTCLVDLDGRALAGGEPPAELALHLEIYRRRDDVAAVGHTHQPAATAALGSANSGRTDIPTYPLSDQIRTPEQGSELARTLGRGTIVHMRDHGVAVAGTGIDDVVAQAVELEAWARSRSRP
jgi:ribulose-5-phosphate 4-epimerase/fuculose-1-phosphate aldolase